MTNFQEDMLFKNVSDEDASILLEIMGKKSETAKVWTKELRYIDPTYFKPDLILELDDSNEIIEFQSTPVDDEFSKRGLSYVAIANQKKKNNKQVNLSVLNTAEYSKIVEYKYNKFNVFRYEVIGLNYLDSERILNNVKIKLKNNEMLNTKEIILLSLVPLCNKGNNIIKFLYEVIKILFSLKDLTLSQKNLAFSIVWLTTDKFVDDQLERDILCDLLGGRMSLIHEYGENKYNFGVEQGIEKIIVNLLKSGEAPADIANKTDVSFKKVMEIKNKNNL